MKLAAKGGQFARANFSKLGERERERRVFSERSNREIYRFQTGKSAKFAPFQRLQTIVRNRGG
jgi:hypothetical protein